MVKGEAKKRGRRPHGTGSVVERTDGRFQGRYYAKGKAYYVYADTYSACNKLLLKAIKEQKKKVQEKPRILLKDYLASWLKGRLDYRANSERNRGTAIRTHINPALGEMEISKITRDDVRGFVADLVDLGLAPSTIRNIYEALSAALNAAVDDELIDASPCARIKLPPKKKTEHMILDIAQAHRLCEEMKDHWLAPITKLAIATGMRKAELAALQWSDVDLIRGLIIVRHNVAYVPVRKFVPGPPKSRTSERIITLTQFGIEVLREHRLAQIATRDVWAENDLVFPNKHGYFLALSNFNKCLNIMIERAGVPRVTFHELRHSAASILIVLGINIKVIQELLGHSSIVITLELYAHLLPGAQGEAMRQYHEAWERAKREANGQMDVKRGVETDEKGA